MVAAVAVAVAVRFQGVWARVRLWARVLVGVTLVLVGVTLFFILRDRSKTRQGRTNNQPRPPQPVDHAQRQPMPQGVPLVNNPGFTVPDENDGTRPLRGRFLVLWPLFKSLLPPRMPGWSPRSLLRVTF